MKDPESWALAFLYITVRGFQAASIHSLAPSVLLQPVLQGQLDAFRAACATKAAALAGVTTAVTPSWGIMVSLRGPEVKIGLLREHGSIKLDAGEKVTLVALKGEDADAFVGGRDSSGNATIGVELASLCSVVTPGA